MELLLQRKPSKDDTTLGDLFLESGAHFCHTLEDQVRVDDPSTEEDEGEKVYGKTAIPAGRYKITITFSPKFQKDMLLVNEVPGFTGIRIHSGNDAEDTLGCILVGQVTDSDTRIHGGSVVLPQLFAMIKKALESDEVWLTIRNHA
jgi:hypothetical protein